MVRMKGKDSYAIANVLTFTEEKSPRLIPESICIVINVPGPFLISQKPIQI